MRVAVYVDGFNLYYRGLKGTKFKWLDLGALSREFLRDDEDLVSIKYFTADVSPRSGDPTAPSRQEAYLRALRTIPCLSIYKGRFLPKTKTRPLVEDPGRFVEVHDTEEKGSDVNLATHLVHDAHRGVFDTALVVSQDTDLCEPMRIVNQDLGKTLGVIWLEASAPGKRHRRVSNFIKHANPSILRRAQFPDVVIGRGGRKISKPPEWE
jgi:uncharacterized LabA/DUF88 family protein